MCSRNITNLIPVRSHSSILSAESFETKDNESKLHSTIAGYQKNERLAGPLLSSDTLKLYHACLWRENFPTSICDMYLQEIPDEGNFLSDIFKGPLWFSSRKKTARTFGCNDCRPRRDFINSLPDDLLCQIFSFLPETRDRFSCASVCTRWLKLQSHMPRECIADTHYGNQSGLGHFKSDSTDQIFGDLSRSLAGKTASDVRLSAIAIGTSARGGLGKLCIRGGPAFESKVVLTDIGLSAVGISCVALRILSLWNCPNITDNGLSTIGTGCHLLEKVDLYKCPLIGDSGLQSIAQNCPSLSFLSLDECDGVGDKALLGIGEHCNNLAYLNIRRSPLISDLGIKRAFCNLNNIKMLKLDALKISASSVFSMPVRLRHLRSLKLCHLDLVTNKSFSLFGSSTVGMASLRKIIISSCNNFTDQALIILGKESPCLKHVSLSNCDTISDIGLMVFVKEATALEVLRIQKCNNITGMALTAILFNNRGKLRDVKFRDCHGITDTSMISCSESNSRVESLCLADCYYVSDFSLSIVGQLCPGLLKLDLSGLNGITDEGMLAMLSHTSCRLSSVNLSGCIQLTDRAITALASHCGYSLRDLVLNGCVMVSDKSLISIANHCVAIEDIDVSNCAISNEGIKALVTATGDTLISLNLSGCCNITGQVLFVIQEKCVSLLDLNLKNCEGVTRNFLVSFLLKAQKYNVLY